MKKLIEAVIVDLGKFKKARDYVMKKVDKACGGKKLTDMEVEEIGCKYERAIHFGPKATHD